MLTSIVKQRRCSAVRIQKALRKERNRKIALELFYNAKKLRMTKERNALVTVQCWWRTTVAGLRVRKILSQVDKMADINRKMLSEKPLPANEDNKSLANRGRYESSLNSAPTSDIPEMFDQLEKFMQATIKNLSTQKKVHKWTVPEEAFGGSKSLDEKNVDVNKLRGENKLEENICEVENRVETQLSQLKHWEVELRNREEDIRMRQLQAQLELRRRETIEIPVSSTFFDAAPAPRFKEYCATDIVQTACDSTAESKKNIIAADPSCHEEWAELWDPNTSRKFYFHKDDRQVAWRTPPRKHSSGASSYITDGELMDSITDGVKSNLNAYKYVNYEDNYSSNDGVDTMFEARPMLETTDETTDVLGDTSMLAQSAKSGMEKNKEADSDWEQVYDNETGCFYWYNVASGVSQWMDPHDETKGVVSGLKSGNKPEDDSWVPYFDDQSGRDYWYNTISGESSWERH